VPPDEIRARVNEFGQPVGAPVDWQPATPPRPVTLAGRWCTVVPLDLAHVPELYAALAPGPPGQWTYLTFGPCDTKADLREVVSGYLANPGFVSFAILDAAGRARGIAAYLRIDPAIGSLEVGGILLGEGLRRTAAATEAMWLLARNAFEQLGFRRYEWKCDALNTPSRYAAERLGFRFEGVWRQATIYKGRNRDTAWFAMTDADWPEVSSAIQAWLDPTNFDAAGRQLTPLRIG
jgi:RimJ/RimL family protein N-acetyltransferase